MIKNSPGQVIGSQMVTPSGAPFGGVVTAYVDIDGLGMNLGSVGAGICTQDGTNGYFKYFPSQAETNGNLLGFQFVGVGAVPITVQVATVTPSQQSALSTATGGVSTSVTQLIADAFAEVAIYAPAFGAIPAGDQSFALGKLNRLFDNMTNDRRLTFSQSFTPYTLTPNQQQYTIGPNSANFTASARPINIRAAQIQMTDVNPNVFIPINVKDWRYWATLPVQQVFSSLPTDLYYQPDWPNGNIFLWPIPTLAYQLVILSRVGFGLVGASDTIWYPHGYRDYLTLKLAKMLVPAYPGAIVAPSLNEQLRDLESTIFNTNDDIPYLEIDDPGMGSTDDASGRGVFNYKSRTVS